MTRGAVGSARRRPFRTATPVSHVVPCDATGARRVRHDTRFNRNVAPRRLVALVAILGTLSCAGEHALDVRHIVTQYTIFERSRVLWPLSYYSDSAQAHFLYTEYLNFDDTGRMLTRESYLLTQDLKTGTATNQKVTAHKTVQRKGNTLLLGAPDACAPHADCIAGRVLRIPETGLLVEGPGRYGADSLVFGPPPALISRSR